MPLSKERDKERKKRAKLSNLIQPKSGKTFQPNSNLVQPVIPKIEGLTMEGNKITGVVSKERPPSDQPLPIYNWQLHKPGDRVRIWQGNKWVESIVPLEDGSLDEPVSGKLISSNIFKPSFNPAPKPARRPSRTMAGGPAKRDKVRHKIMGLQKERRLP